VLVDLRQLLTTPILFTPFVARGRRGIRFEGRIGLAAVGLAMRQSQTLP
jgi:hypothetical protein